MKKTLNTPRVLSSMVAVALLGLIVGSPAWGDKPFRTHKVHSNNSTNGGHEGATYAVVPNINNEFILVFVQYRGRVSDRGSFICDDATWNETEDAYSCTDPNTNEKLTIGPIAGQFCNELRDDPDRGGDKILTLDQCYEEDVRCSCYEIGQEHLDSMSKDNDGLLMPPGGGAGTGKNN